MGHPVLVVTLMYRSWSSWDHLEEMLEEVMLLGVTLYFQTRALNSFVGASLSASKFQSRRPSYIVHRHQSSSTMTILRLQTIARAKGGEPKWQSYILQALYHAHPGIRKVTVCSIILAQQYVPIYVMNRCCQRLMSPLSLRLYGNYLTLNSFPCGYIRINCGNKRSMAPLTLKFEIQKILLM